MTPSPTNTTEDLHSVAHILHEIGYLDSESTVRKAADLITAQQREIEHLTPSDPWHWKNRATKAEAEVAELRAKVATPELIALGGRAVEAFTKDGLPKGRTATEKLLDQARAYTASVAEKETKT